MIATLGNANDWPDIEDFLVANEEVLKQYFELLNGIPSHNTIARVIGIIDTMGTQVKIAEQIFRFLSHIVRKYIS